MFRVLVSSWVMLLAAGLSWGQADKVAPLIPEPRSGGYFDGVVKEVDDTHMIIDGRGHFMVGGRLFAGVYVFGLSATLRRGDYPRNNIGFVGNCYRVQDVKPGDVVGLDFSNAGQRVHVVSIRIVRRPGGKVPPSPAQNPKDRHQYHEAMNALQAWEEHRTPIPDEYHPGGNQAGIAPMPRPAKPRPISD